MERIFRTSLGVGSSRVSFINEEKAKLHSTDSLRMAEIVLLSTHWSRTPRIGVVDNLSKLKTVWVVAAITIDQEEKIILYTAVIEQQKWENRDSK